MHEVESSPNRDSIDAPVIARTANPDATRNSLNRPERRAFGVGGSKQKHVWRSSQLVKRGARRGSTGAEGTIEEAELSLLTTDKTLNEFFTFHAKFLSHFNSAPAVLSSSHVI